MNCVLCQVFGKETANNPLPQSAEGGGRQEIPGPVIYRYGLPGHFPGNRAPMLTDARYQSPPPGVPTYGIDRFVPQPVTMKSPVGPTDDRIRFTRNQARGGFIRWVREKYVIPGGPAGAAQGLYGWIHNYGYMTIADTLKPAQQLPRYTLASIDTQTMIDRARASLLRTLYGVG